MRRLGGLAVGLMVAMAGCRSAAPPPQGETAGESTAKVASRPAPLDPATLGTVSGVVKFAGKPPEPVRIDTSMDPACGLSGGDIFSEQYAVKDGKLGNVYVYVKSGPAAAMYQGTNGEAPVVLDQKGCRYTPHVIAVMAGASVEFRNDDPTMHNVHTMPTVAGNAPIDLSESPRGTPEVKQFKKPEEMMPVRCNNHPWMNAFINVSATPFFAVTGADGKFTLRDMPAGDYVLGAVQEKLGEETLQVTVKAQADAKADFSFAMK